MCFRRLVYSLMRAVEVVPGVRRARKRCVSSVIVPLSEPKLCEFYLRIIFAGYRSRGQHLPSLSCSLTGCRFESGDVSTDERREDRLVGGVERGVFLNQKKTKKPNYGAQTEWLTVFSVSCLLNVNTHVMCLLEACQQLRSRKISQFKT